MSKTEISCKYELRIIERKYILKVFTKKYLLSKLEIGLNKQKALLPLFRQSYYRQLQPCTRFAY